MGTLAGVCVIDWLDIHGSGTFRISNGCNGYDRYFQYKKLMHLYLHTLDCFSRHPSVTVTSYNTKLVKPISQSS